MNSDLIALREAVEDDRNFIYSTYLRGKYYGEYGGVKDIPKDIFMKNEHDILEHALDRSDTKVMVACLKDDPSVLLGYSIVVNSALFFVFVKAAWRKIGLARSLVPTETKIVTNLTAVGRSILKSHPQVVFNPYLN